MGGDKNNWEMCWTLKTFSDLTRPTPSLVDWRLFRAWRMSPWKHKNSPFETYYIYFNHGFSLTGLTSPNFKQSINWIHILKPWKQQLTPTFLRIILGQLKFNLLLSVDGFWSPVELNGYETERNGSFNGFGLFRNERNGQTKGSGFILKKWTEQTVNER